MNMIEVESSPLNSFGPQGLESPSEQIYVLTAGQLEQVISQAVARAQAPLLDRLEATEARLQDLAARFDALEEGVGCKEGEEPWLQEKSLPGGQGSQISLPQVVQDLQAEKLALKRELEALHELRPWLEAISKKVARLEAPKISRKTEARAEKIKRYLQERPDHRATFETLRGHLGIDKARLNETIRHLMARDPGRYGIMRLPGDKRGRALIMLPK